jgi:hypothetical protein
MSSASSSSAELHRSITLRRSDIEEYVEGRTQGYRVRFDVVTAVCILAEIFVYQRQAGLEPGTTTDEFSNIASPADFEEYPVNNPSEITGFFRLSYVDLIFRSVELLEQSAQDLISDVCSLVTSLDQLDVLVEHDVTLTGSMCPVDLSVPVVQVVIDNRDPTVNDDITKNYAPGSWWINSTTGKVFVIIANAPPGEASWTEISKTGETGATGPTGATGETGAAGAGVHVADVNPGPSDDLVHGFQIGSFWLNFEVQRLLVSIDDTTDAAVWQSVGAIISSDNQNMPALATSSDEDLACDTTIAHTPTRNGLVEVRVNGHTTHVGDGTKVADCYFSDDGGTNVRNIASVVEGDKLYWMGSVAKYQLITADRISFVYGV